MLGRDGYIHCTEILSKISFPNIRGRPKICRKIIEIRGNKYRIKLHVFLSLTRDNLKYILLYKEKSNFSVCFSIFT